MALLGTFARERRGSGAARQGRREPAYRVCTRAIEEILAEAEGDPEVARNAPYTTPVRRLDEVGATKRPVVRQPL